MIVSLSIVSGHPSGLNHSMKFLFVGNILLWGECLLVKQCSTTSTWAWTMVTSLTKTQSCKTTFWSWIAFFYWKFCPCSVSYRLTTLQRLRASQALKFGSARVCAMLLHFKSFTTAPVRRIGRQPCRASPSLSCIWTGQRVCAHAPCRAQLYRIPAHQWHEEYSMSKR